MSSRHQTVLLHEAVNALRLTPAAIVVDATLGAAGHAKEIISQLDERGTYIGFDADQTAIDAAKETLKGSTAKVVLLHENFRRLGTALTREGIDGIDAALFDLGWRAEQLEAARGFSFQHDGPLLMTYDATPNKDTLTAREIVNTWDEMSISDVIYGWGEERFARQIARAISEARAVKPIETTFELARIVGQAVPKWYQKRRINPATKTFQALRIAVNDEMGALKDGLETALTLLRNEGRLSVITFHSLEDRFVKQFFRKEEAEGKGLIITKKPIAPSREEVMGNPRTRSAKLRVFEKQQTQ